MFLQFTFFTINFSNLHVRWFMFTSSTVFWKQWKNVKQMTWTHHDDMIIKLYIPVRQSCPAQPCTQVQLWGAVHSLFTPQPPGHIAAKSVYMCYNSVIPINIIINFSVCITLPRRPIQKIYIYLLYFTHCHEECTPLQLHRYSSTCHS